MAPGVFGVQTFESRHFSRNRDLNVYETGSATEAARTWAASCSLSDQPVSCGSFELGKRLVDFGAAELTRCDGQGSLRILRLLKAGKINVVLENMAGSPASCGEVFSRLCLLRNCHSVALACQCSGFFCSAFARS